MPTYLQRVHNGRITKASASTPNPTLSRSLSTAVMTLRCTKPGVLSLKRSSTVAPHQGKDDHDSNDSLAQFSPPALMLQHQVASDVTSAIVRASDTMFDDIPDRSGLNSVGISNVLNFRKRLPKIVTFSHVHALTGMSSRSEKEIQGLLADGQLVKLSLVGRGNDVSGLGEVLIRKEDYSSLLQESDVSQDTTDDFMKMIAAPSQNLALLGRGHLKATQINSLTRAGFLVSSGLWAHKMTSPAIASYNDSIVAAAAVSRAAAGSQGAVGGDAAFEVLGGNGTFRRSTPSENVRASGTNLMLSAPGLAAFLQLLTAGRNHLLDLLRKAGGKHQEMPLSLLKERWNGNVEDDSTVSVHRRLRGDFAGVLPARTRKWKRLYGLRFEWILQECLGAGLIECWDTGTVGLGVRALG